MMSQPDEEIVEGSRINRRQLLVGAVGFAALSACAKTNDAGAKGDGAAVSLQGETEPSTEPSSEPSSGGGEATTEVAESDAEFDGTEGATAPSNTVEPANVIAADRSTEEPFVGLQVADFPRTDPGPGVATRLHIGYGADQDFAAMVTQLAEHPSAARIEALVIGAYVNDSLDLPAPAIAALVANAKSFPSVKALFFGDVSTEVSEISWIECGDQAALANAFPELETLLIRGSGDGSMAGLSLTKLRTLIIETGGLKPSVVREALAVNLPALDHLELWLGTSEYGGEATVSDLIPLFERRVFKTLKYVGLRNSEIADAIAVAISRSPLLSSISELDLSLGTISDEGFAALASMDPSPNLVRLNVSHHYAAPAAVESLVTAMKQRSVELDATDVQTGAADERYVTISE
jgi:hypothetical protein